MSRKRTATIDGEKLRNLIEATGRSLPDASEELGFSRKYLGDICRDGKAPVQSLSLIALVFNIPAALYEIRPLDPVEMETPEDVPQGTELGMIIKELREIKDILRRERYEQKSWNLSFNRDTADGPVHHGDHPVGGIERQVR